MEESIAATMAKCLMLLSRDRGDIDHQSAVIQQQATPTSTQSRMYECKTCNKQFSSFQALGGYRASHNKSRLMELYSLDNQRISYNQQQAKKQKIHECSICGLKFSIGQPTIGLSSDITRMGRHGAAMTESSSATERGPPTIGLSSDITRQKEEPLKRSNSSRRVVSYLNLDLSSSLFPLDDRA
ncbi:hypothetical protein C5167_001786 [Papaver somniferum]|uniref:C2H2-type domain-containing protein n=1 Tax=Papaver somniferum TaxID=3469 RepID=A0A4Y7KTB1_PAPSO|nr:zinc finger protein ZAT11-like [Papaver somniferum]RZC76096.1 hypothetical protein C5167_001786 [Papaver somniferum]